jgi:ribonuclease HI
LNKIYLKGVRAYGYVGYLPEENVLGQWFEVDATLWVDFEKSTYSDAIEDTVNYVSCIQKIEKLIQTQKYKLIERLAGAIADSLLEDPQIAQVELRVIKRPPIPNFQGSVAVEIRRSRPSQFSDQPNDQSSNKSSYKSSEKDIAGAALNITTEPKQAAIAEVPKPTPTLSAKVADRALTSTIVSIHTDGACSKNPGPGGWGVVVHFADGSIKEIGGGMRDTTNNQMELQGAIAALEFLAVQPQSQPVDLYTDSKYVLDGITKWIKGWKKNGWQTKDRKPVKNQEYWQKLDQLNASNVRWHWVEGHSGDPDNERCDAIARSYVAREN